MRDDDRANSNPARCAQAAATTRGTYCSTRGSAGASLALNRVEESPADGSLGLSPTPGGGQPLTDAAGTFGGLQLPTGVATDNAGGIYLLDAASGKIKRFDPCECRFDEVPCTGGIGAAPRQFSDPHGIAIFCGDLFVCDTGNGRVQVFALKGMTLRALWQTPAEADLPQSWKPYDIAFDSRGRAFVTDFANGVVHSFDRRGNWQIKFGSAQPAGASGHKLQWPRLRRAGRQQRRGRF